MGVKVQLIVYCVAVSRKMIAYEKTKAKSPCRMKWCYINMLYRGQFTSYTMGCPSVREDNPRALASGLFYVQEDNPWDKYFIPPTSVLTLHSTDYFVLKLVRVV